RAHDGRRQQRKQLLSPEKTQTIIPIEIEMNVFAKKLASRQTRGPTFRQFGFGITKRYAPLSPLHGRGANEVVQFRISAKNKFVQVERRLKILASGNGIGLVEETLPKSELQFSGLGIELKCLPVMPRRVGRSALLQLGGSVCDAFFKSSSID